MNFSDIVTFSRASTACERRSDGKFYSVAQNVARQADYIWNGSALEKAGLLIEGARTNLLTYSHNSNNAAWSPSGAPVISAAGISPLFDGKTAYKFTNDNAGVGRSVGQGTGVLGSSPACVSMIIENVSATDTLIAILDAGVSDFVATATLLWADGSVTLSSPVGTGEAGGVIDLGVGPNGGKMYKLWVSATPSNAANSGVAYVYPAGYNQSALSAIVHNVQYEVGAFPSSPILTDAAAATRAADVATVATAGWFADGQAGSVLVDAVIPDPEYAVKRYAVIIWDDINDNNSIGIRRDSSNGKAAATVYDCGALQAALASSAVKATGFKAALGWAANDIAFYADGMQAGTDSGATIPDGLVKLSLGTDYGGNTPLFGYIRNLRYWPRRLSNAELQALTA